MNRFCSYLWVVVLIPVGRIRSLFDKFQTGYVWKFALQFSDEFVGNVLRRVKAFLALARFLTWRK
ncbi:hypothetical protein BSPWISOXPB_5743 [uncultured Gammaproteobacteria bacterium]|nr:hypothetical protein BSPWISOXPB_5743 [uncultured Gammaproteobacteria bacterium]